MRREITPNAGLLLVRPFIRAVIDINEGQMLDALLVLEGSMIGVFHERIHRVESVDESLGFHHELNGSLCVFGE